VRGLDYYTRTVFEFVSSDLGAQSTVCAGGRYDGLVAQLGGPPTPGVGFGLGLERFLMLLSERGEEANEPSGIAVIALGAAARLRAVRLVAALRRVAHVPVTIDYNDSKIAAQFKRAERGSARAAVIIGDDELASEKLLVRDLVTRVQDTLAMRADDGLNADRIIEWYRALPAANGAAA
jgi:histidyl-tRNA synthetase